MTEAYAMGFSKVASDYGLNPEELYKAAGSFGAFARGFGKGIGRAASRAGRVLDTTSGSPVTDLANAVRPAFSGAGRTVRNLGRYVTKHPYVGAAGAGAIGYGIGKNKGQTQGYQNGVQKGLQTAKDLYSPMTQRAVFGGQQGLQH